MGQRPTVIVSTGVSTLGWAAACRECEWTSGFGSDERATRLASEHDEQVHGWGNETTTIHVHDEHGNVVDVFTAEECGRDKAGGLHFIRSS